MSLSPEKLRKLANEAARLRSHRAFVEELDITLGEIEEMAKALLAAMDPPTPTLRDQLAMAALGYLKSDPNLDMQPTTLAVCAYEVADAMLRERSNG